MKMHLPLGAPQTATVLPSRTPSVEDRDRVGGHVFDHGERCTRMQNSRTLAQYGGPIAVLKTTESKDRMTTRPTYGKIRHGGFDEVTGGAAIDRSLHFPQINV